MFVVALAELATSAEDEAPTLAADLGLAVYEARLRLAAGLPCILLSTPERERALELLGRLRARNHGAVAFDTHAVVVASSMLAVRRFRFGPDAVELEPSDGAPPGAARLPFAKVSALIRAVHRSSYVRTEDVKEVKFRAGAAIATGGLVMTKVTHKKIRSTIEEREQVLYIFGDNDVPWLMRESTAQCVGLGEAMQATRMRNFAASVGKLRDRVPWAHYDERLLAVRKPPEVPVDEGEPRSGNPATGGIDLLAHTLALWLSRGGGEGERAGFSPLRTKP